MTATYEQLQQQIESAGLAARGGFHVAPGDALGDARTLIPIGFTRIQHWAQVRSTATGCRTVGCLARRACPIGSENAYLPVQASFHMRAFAPRDD